MRRILFTALLCIPQILVSQVLKDSLGISLIRNEIKAIYEMNFAGAHKIQSSLEIKYPGHPSLLLLRSMIIYKENYPLTSVSPDRVSFESNLKICIHICETYNQQNEAEFLLINLCARGLLLMFYADNNLKSEVIPLTAGTYWYIRKAFIFHDSFPDFNFFTGLYNYYREAYPEVHPVYQAVSFLFPRGDRIKGLKELRIASEESIFIRAETCFFLLSIWENFENNYSEVSHITESLHSMYPANIQFHALYIKNLLLLKRYDQAEKEIVPGINSDNPYFRAQLIIFKGIIEEKKYHNDAKAKSLYYSGIEEMKRYGDFGNEFSAYAYYGLSRVCTDNPEDEKKYRKNADKLTDYRKVNFD